MKRSRLFDALDAMDWQWKKMEWHLFSSRAHHKNTLEKAEKMALATSEECLVCDGDGWGLEPERFRRGWTLTEKGRAWLQLARSHAVANGFPTITDRKISELMEERSSDARVAP